MADKVFLYNLVVDDDERKHQYKRIIKYFKNINNRARTQEHSTSTVSTASSSRIEVLNLPPSAIKRKIEILFLEIAHSILDGKGFSFDVPSCANMNQTYLPEENRMSLKNEEEKGKEKNEEEKGKENKKGRSFSKSSTAGTSTMTLRIMQIIYELCIKELHMTKRELYYCKVKGKEKSNMIDDKGVVIGNLQLSIDDNMIDCMTLGMGSEGCKFPQIFTGLEI